MPSNKNAFKRYLILDELLSDRMHNYSIQDLTRIVEVKLSEDGIEGVSRRCIEKDIVDLEYAPIYAEIERYKAEDGKRCLRYADPTFSIFNKKLSNEECNLLCEVLETIGQFDGLDNFEWLDEFKAKLGVNDHKKIIYFSNNPYLKNSNLLGSLFNYISHRIVINICFQDFNQEEQFIDLHPYLLKQYNNRWFLIGAIDMNYQIKTFALDRINKIKPLTSKTYREQPDDLTERFEEIIGVTYLEGEENNHIIFWVSDKDKGYIITKPIHGSQKSIRNQEEASLRAAFPMLNGGEFFSIDCLANYELIRELASFGSELMVLSPGNIQSEVYQRVKKMEISYQEIIKKQLAE